jgi:ABC-type dipeptide/oligopeptide/nickel transport system permease subunit
MSRDSAPVLDAPRSTGGNLFTRSTPGLIGLIFLVVMVVACIGTLPWTLRQVRSPGMAALADAAPTSPAYDNQNRLGQLLPPTWWWAPRPDAVERRTATTEDTALRRLADGQGVLLETIQSLRLLRAKKQVNPAYDVSDEMAALEATVRQRGERPSVPLDQLRLDPSEAELRAATPYNLMGTDLLGRDMFARVLTGGGMSLMIGIAAAALSVFLGVMYGAIAGYAGGRIDGVMMRIVDVLYGLPYILLVVLLAVAVDAGLDRWQEARSRTITAQINAYVERGIEGLAPDQVTPAVVTDLTIRAREIYGTAELAAWQVQAINVITLLVAIGGVSWLTMARVIRGQVLSLKAQPFVEAARAIGVSPMGIFFKHLLPNLVGPIIVYATLTVPQAILQESFLSFLGIGVKPPLPSWGNLASDGLQELNTVQSNWWLLLFPCLLLGLTLLALNFVGEGLREAFDPKRRQR